MKGLKVESSRIAAAIRGAFGSAEVCHCQGPAKLSEEEVFAYLVRKRVLHLSDVVGDQAITIAAIRDSNGGSLPYSTVYDLERRRGVTHLHQLKDWTFGDLLRIPHVGQVAAQKIERAIAEYGILLKDGDPVLLEEVAQEPGEEGPAESIVNGTPEEIAMACSKGLMKIADELSRSASLLMRAAVKIPHAEKRKTHDIKTYLKHEHTCAAEVRRIAQPFIDLEAREKRRPVCRAKTAKRRTAPSNVVEGRFPVTATSQ